MSDRNVRPMSADVTEQTPLLNGPNVESDRRPSEDGKIARGDDDGAADSSEAPLAKELTTKELLAIMCTIWVGMFFAALDTTIVATLTAPISSEFNSLSLLSWLATGYLIANAACQPLSGKLTDIFSRRTGLVFSNFFFAAGCLICGLAQREWVIILGRVVSGIGGGGVNTVSTFIMSDLVPLRRRGLWQGYANLVYGLGMGLGGLFGGLLNDTLGWRWAFLIQVPFLVVAGVLVVYLIDIPVKETGQSAFKRVDFLGAALLVLSLVLFLLGLNTGGNQLPWNHPFVVTVLPLSLVFFLVFIYVEDQVAKEPIIPVRLVCERTVLSACISLWLLSMSVYIGFYYLPLYLQVRGKSAMAAGVALTPIAIGISVGSLVSGYIMRRAGRYYLLNCVCVALPVLSAALYCTFDLYSLPWQIYLYPFPVGVGYGGLLTVTLVAFIAAVDHKDQAVITAASYAFRSTGCTIGVSIGSAVFQNVLVKHLWARFGDREHAARVIRSIRDDLKYMDHLPGGWSRDEVLDSYMMALRMTFVLALVLAAAAALSSLFMREHKLHSTLARK